MATPTIPFSTVTSPGGTGTTITPTLSTHAAGDVLFIFVGNTGVTTWTAPAGWTRLNQTTMGSSANGIVGTWLYRRVLSGDSIPLANPVCSLGATVTRHAVCRTIRGADLEGVFTLSEWDDRAFGTNNANPIRPPTVISNAPEKLFLHDYVQKSATNAPDPTGWTQDQEAISSGTIVINCSHKDVPDQATTLSNQDASPTSGVRWVAGIISIPSPDYPYFRSGSQATAVATNVTPALPTGTTASDVNGRKDLIIATVEAAGNNIAIAPNTPADWTEITGWASNTSGNGTTVRKYWCLFDGSMDRRFNRPTSGEISVCLTTYHNCHQTAPIGVVNIRQNANSTTSTWDALTRTYTKACMQATCVADATPTFTVPAGWLERMDGLGIVCADQPFNAIGSTASASFTLSTASPTLVGLLEIVGVFSSANLTVQNSSHAQTAASPSLTQVHVLTLQNASHAQTADSPTLAVSAATDLVIQSAAHGHASESLSLTQSHSLVTQDASHAHAADSLVLTQAHQLATANSSHAHSVDSLVLTQAHALGVQSAEHGHTAEPLVLTGTHALVVQGASHGHTSESLTLTQVHVLSVQNAEHSHVAENLTLAGASDLAIQNIVHEHSADSLTLTQVHSLAIQDGVHGHTVQNVSLTQAHSIVVASSSHDHTADSLTLESAYVLAIQSANHAQTAESLTLAQVHSLAVSNSTHGLTSANLTLAQARSLITASATHGHTAGNISLIEASNLSVDSALHLHSADALTLTQAHSLTVNGSAHSQTAKNLALTQVHALVMQNAFHVLTSRNIRFGPPRDVYTVSAEGRSLQIANEGRLMAVPTEDVELLKV